MSSGEGRPVKVKIMDKRLVVGATSSQITTLAAWDLGGTLADVSLTGAPADGSAAVSPAGVRPR